MKRSALGLTLPCPCGAKAPVQETGKGYYTHCPGCGRMAFFKNPVLLERLKYGELCPHHPEPKPCKGGSTTWCPLCRVRTFIYEASP